MHAELCWDRLVDKIYPNHSSIDDYLKLLKDKREDHRVSDWPPFCADRLSLVYQHKPLAFHCSCSTIPWRAVA